jgi:hypothetical protein
METPRPRTHHERWCPLCVGYDGPLEDDLDCHCDDETQSDLYYDAMDRFSR